MATHKVPQDVEAEDKLLGPLSLKQLIFTVLGLGFGYLTYYFAAKIHPLSGILWLPFSLFFLVLGLYQRKDQPVEVFLMSAFQFYTKSRKRIWNQEGYEERVIITAPPKVDKHYTKDFTGEEAKSRLANLSNLMDSRGWAAKLSEDWQNPQLAVAAASDRLAAPAEASTYSLYDAPDVQDSGVSLVARGIDTQLNISDAAHKQQAIERARRLAQQSSVATEPEPTLTTPEPAGPSPLVTPEPQSTPAPDSAPYTPPTPAPQESQTEDGSVEISLH